MNSTRFPLIRRVTGILVLPLIVLCVHAAPSTATAETNSAPAQAPVPVAVFDFTNGVVKDPFFPLSTRLAVRPANTPIPVFTRSNFLLKGLGGSASHRLALINNRTMAEGEEADVTIPSGERVRIHCVQIKDSSVVIRVVGQPDNLELRFEDKSML
jgi:hypothetical protein